MSDAHIRYLRFCQQFKKARKKSGLSLRELQRITRVHYSIMSRFEHGQIISALHAITLTDWATEQNL